ncbi:MAG TPA: CoA transferase [Steroidobacteraceae bacterium]|nr:CoA transferase [Steroidobacteraceae bacterium]
MSALDGIRVLDFGHYAAGPLTALLLAENGAEVIHVDRPGPLSMPAHDDAFLNRSKQRITLDLKSPADRSTARSLAASCDVLIENFRPGVMRRLGLDAAALREPAPQLIYCSLPGFAARDPRAAVQAWEGIVSAAAGLYNERSPAGQLARGASPYCDLPLASNFAAFQAATAIVMALIARRKSGQGQQIEAPLFDAAIELLGPAVPDTFPNYTIIYGGGIYACAAGHIFFNANNPRFLFWLLDALGVTADWRAAGLLDTESINGKDAARNAVLRRRLADCFLTRTAAEWEEFGAQHQLPLARIGTAQEWQRSAQARASGAVATVEDPELGTLAQPGRLTHLSRDGEAIRHPRHRIDQDRAAILSHLRPVAPSPGAVSQTPSPAARPADSITPACAGALAGIRVLDLANILAGPSVGRWLADFGAEVIKLNDPNSQSVALHDYLNRGKKSALVDVTVPAGRDVVLRLAAGCDVFLSNFPKPTVARYGYDEAALRQHNPQIIHASVSCYGATGPWSERRGYEPQAQSCAGLMAHYGGTESPVMLPYLVNDYGTGILGAFAVGLALFARARSGMGQRAECSLAQTATWHLWGTLPQSFNQRLYRAADGWLYLGTRANDTLALLDLFHIQDTRHASDASLGEFIASAIAREPRAHWLAACAARGIAAMALATQREAMQHEYALARGVTHAARQRLSGTLEHPGITVHLSATPKIHGAVPEAVGSDLDEVLGKAGLAAAMPELLAAGVISRTLAKPKIAPPKA